MWYIMIMWYIIQSCKKYFHWRGWPNEILHHAIIMWSDICNNVPMMWQHKHHRVTSCGWQNEIQWNCLINARNGTLKWQKLAYFASWRSGILWYSMRWSHRKSQNWLIFVYCWNSSAPGRFKKKISKFFFKLVCWIGILRNLSEIALKRMPQNLRW